MNLNWKALTVGIFAMLTLSLVTSLLMASYLPEIYSSLVMPGQISGLYAAFPVLLSLIQFTAPGYLSAWISNRSRMLHGLIVGACGGIIILIFNIANNFDSWLYNIFIYIISIFMSAAGGKIRQYQIDQTL